MVALDRPRRAPPAARCGDEVLKRLANDVLKLQFVQAHTLHRAFAFTLCCTLGWAHTLQ